MKKITKVSISGIPFMLDQDAERILSDYLEALTRKFGNSSENELVSDIENRIAELLSQRKPGSNSVISAEIIKEIISQIGSVSSIERDSLDTESGIRFNFNNVGKRTSKQRETPSQSGGFFESILKVVAWILMVLSGINALGIISAAVVILFAKDFIGYYAPQATPCTILLILSSILLFILSFMALLSRVINNGRSWFGKWITILVLLVGSVVVGVSSILSGLRIANEYKAEETITEIVNIDLQGETLYVIKEGDRSFPFNRVSLFNTDLFGVYEHADSVTIPVNFRYRENNESGSYLKITKSSHGRDFLDAKQKADNLRFPYRISGDTLYLNRSFTVNKNDNFRSGEIWVRVVSSKMIERF